MKTFRNVHIDAYSLRLSGLDISATSNLTLFIRNSSCRTMSDCILQIIPNMFSQDGYIKMEQE